MAHVSVAITPDVTPLVTQEFHPGTFHGGGLHACSNNITVRRDLAEELLVAPILRNLLSDNAVDHAIKTIRQLACEEATSTPRVVNRELARANGRIAELERLVREGVLSANEAAAPLKRAQKERNEAAAIVPEQRPQITEAEIMQALAEYKAAVKDLRGKIVGSDATEARAILQDAYGSVRVAPTVEGTQKYLTATFESAELATFAEMRLEKSSRINALRIGSGGRI